MWRTSSAKTATVRAASMLRWSMPGKMTPAKAFESRLSSRRVVFMCFSTIGGRFSMLVTSMPFNKRRVFANAICGVKCRNRRAKINERTFFIQFNIPPCNTNSPNCASLHFVLESLPQQENLKLECCNRIPLQPFPMRQTFSL